LIQDPTNFYGAPPKVYSGISNPVSSVTISTMVRTNHVFTIPVHAQWSSVLVTTATAHGLSFGQEVQIVGGSDSTFDGTFQVRQVNSANSFTVIAAYNTSHLSATGGAVSTWQVFTRVNTTISTVTQNGSLLTIAPVLMTNIVVGMVLMIAGTGGYVVVSKTASTFSC